MTVGFVVFYQVYKSKNAARFVLDNFREHFPDNPITLISDGGDDFSDIAEEYGCTFHMRENIYGDDKNNYDRHAYNAYRTIEWWKRQKLTCEECGQDYTMILEDDVYIKRHFTIDPPFELRGVRAANSLTPALIKEVNDLGYDASTYGMCGGSVYNAKTFLSIYDDVIKDIEENMDRLMNNDPDLQYRLLGAVDANITYHYNKRGYKYEVAPWLGQITEGSLDLPVIHQWKEHYR